MMSEKKKSLLIINQDQFGYHIDTYEHAKWLKDFFDITFFCWDYDLPKIQLEGITIIYCNRNFNIVKRNLHFRLEVLKMLSKKFDVIFIKYYVGVSMVHLAEKQKRLVCDMRTGSVESSFLKRILFDTVNYLELLTFKNKTFISTSLAKRFRIKIFHLLPLGANPLPFNDKNFIEFHLLYVGTFSHLRIEDTVRGFGLFYQSYKGLIHCKYEIIGSGTAAELDQIKRGIQEFQLEEVVTIKGYIPHDELLPYFQKTNIGVSYVPITKFFDCQPATKTFEYLQSGMTVLATATKENQRVINKNNGILIQDTPESFAQGLEEIYKNRFSYNAPHIQKNARQYAWENIVQHNLYPYLVRLSPEKDIEAIEKEVENYEAVGK